jgi:hypothetical protein
MNKVFFALAGQTRTRQIFFPCSSWHRQANKLGKDQRHDICAHDYTFSSRLDSLSA